MPTDSFFCEWGYPSINQKQSYRPRPSMQSSIYWTPRSPHEAPLSPLCYVHYLGNQIVLLHISFRARASFARLCATSLASLLTTASLKSGSRLHAALISCNTPSQGLLLSLPCRRAPIIDRQSASTMAGCLTHSAVLRTPSRHASASASSADEHFFSVQ
jgi:hypothetical protein